MVTVGIFIAPLAVMARIIVSPDMACEELEPDEEMRTLVSVGEEL